MNQTECKCQENSIEKCDIFDFMATFVGLSVLHPGGFAATEKLLGLCRIDKDKRVLDIACGKGTTSILIAKKFGCKVIGIDISTELIEEAKFLARKSKVGHLLEFKVADATSLPFNDNEFDVTIAQAMLVLIDEKSSVIKEALRVLKSNGLASWLELTWQKPPTPGFLQQVSDVICAYCMLNVRISDEWNSLFIQSGARNLRTLIYPMKFNGFPGMIKDEGLMNSIRVITKYLTNEKVRSRMVMMNKFFKKHEDIFGYGIYTMTKNPDLA
ncbi:MAG: methyltransferase domain-containing protein [Bacteroidetes bacterium]|nr:methyltransferase domain-containing protein [Bacteroidota bacterium]